MLWLSLEKNTGQTTSEGDETTAKRVITLQRAKTTKEKKVVSFFQEK